MSKFYVMAGPSCVAVHVADNFESATQWVGANLARPRGEFQTIVWQLQTVADGSVGIASWIAPTRPMTEAEVREQAPTIFLQHWLKNPPAITDSDCVDQIVEFIGERIDCIQIASDQWEIDYMLRSDHSGNHKAQQAKAMVKLGETHPRIIEMASRDF